MRLRNIKGSKEIIEKSKYVVLDPCLYKGRWSDVFQNNNPIHIEIGMGKGRFLSQLASGNPNINYVGIEKFSSVLVRAVEKRPELEMDNLFYIRMDAESINEVFDKNEVGLVYLNFSDPWPKERHAKRRLTSTEYFERYQRLLNRNGFVYFKTDNRPLFDFSLEQAALAGWELDQVTFDLHHSEYVEKNIMTEYEERFLLEGKPICRLAASRPAVFQQGCEL